MSIKALDLLPEGRSYTGQKRQNKGRTKNKRKKIHQIRNTDYVHKYT